MAIVKCSECNKEISEHAKSCPKCGNPLKTEIVKTQSRGGPYTAIGYGIIILGFILLFKQPQVGAAAMGIGLVVALIGRFM